MAEAPKANLETQRRVEAAMRSIGKGSRAFRLSNARLLSTVMRRRVFAQDELPKMLGVVRQGGSCALEEGRK